MTYSTDEDINLEKSNLPNGYRIIGWTILNELEIEKWESYYYRDKEVELKMVWEELVDFSYLLIE